MKLNRNSKIFINYFLGPVLFIWLSWSIYRQIQKQPDLTVAWQGIKSSFGTILVWNLIVVILLMIVNWGIEAIKWKIAVRPIQEVSLFKSFRAILSGVSFSVSMPNRIGEYFGRVLYMDEGNRLKTISITIVASISQLIVTLIMGLGGLIILRSGIESTGILSSIWMDFIIYGTATVLLLTLIFYFRLAWMVRWIDKIPAMARFTYLIRALEEYNPKLLFSLLGLSAIRFIVFIVQYYLLFQLFGVHVSAWDCLWAVSVSFLIMAAIPSIALIELVQRGKILTTIMSLFTVNQLAVGLTTAGIWLINLILPAIVGSLLILTLKKLVKEEKRKIIDNR